MDAMKIHYDPKIADEKTWMAGDAACGAGKGRSQLGIYTSSVKANVTCKRCLNKIEKEDFEKFVEETGYTEAEPTAEERLARIAEYIAAEGGLDVDGISDFLDGRRSALRAIRDIVEDKH